MVGTHFPDLKTFHLVFTNYYPVSQLAMHNCHTPVFHSNSVLFLLHCVDQTPGFQDPEIPCADVRGRHKLVPHPFPFLL